MSHPWPVCPGFQVMCVWHCADRTGVLDTQGKPQEIYHPEYSSAPQQTWPAGFHSDSAQRQEICRLLYCLVLVRFVPLLWFFPASLWFSRTSLSLLIEYQTCTLLFPKCLTQELPYTQPYPSGWYRTPANLFLNPVRRIFLCIPGLSPLRVCQDATVSLG